jgi:tartrate dehydratase beta subunit/fumarate hydratase class I family protein
MLEYIERGEKLPVNLRGGVVYHVNVRKYHRYIATVCTGVGAV